MSDERVFVTHAPGDRGLVEGVFRSVRNLPLHVHIAGEEVDDGRDRTGLRGRIDESDAAVAMLTEEGATNQWVNREVGYAVARDVPVVPVAPRKELIGGYLEDRPPVELHADAVHRTVFEVLSALRRELTPLGGLDTPKWYLPFRCTTDGCSEPVTLKIDRDQSDLWRLHDHGRTIHADCEACATRYHFEPATLGLIRREVPQSG